MALSSIILQDFKKWLASDSVFFSIFRNRLKSGQLAIEKEGPMQNIIFDAPFIDEDKVKNGLFLIYLALVS